MSLSTFLLGKHQSKGGKNIDGDLDALFHSSVSAPPTGLAATPVPRKAGAKRRRDADGLLPGPIKRKKSAEAVDRSLTSKPATAEPVAKDPKNVKRKKRIGEASRTKGEAKDSPEGSGEEEIDGGLEEAYERKNRRPEKEDAPGTSKNDEGSEKASDSEVDASQLVHETLANGDRHHEKTQPTRKRIHRHDCPPDETKEQRDARTIFIGNVPVEVAKSKSAQKQLRRHILSHVPGAKIESTRFRSVAFQKPTSAAPGPRTHSLERTAEWRASKGDDVPAPPPRLTSHDKKKVAFIRHELHDEADTVAAYVLFAYGGELAPAEAARSAGVALDNSPFMGRTLRADTLGGDGVGDPKRTVFVGSLDFASHEEDLRTFFEGIVSAERGPRSAVADADSDGEAGATSTDGPRAKQKTWVTRVRIVRDKDTLLGKGIAYVQFADRECVDEILALEPGKLKFAKRKLRVERCKTLPGSLSGLGRPSAATTATANSTTPPSSTRHTYKAVPKGNPNLGAQLAHLSKPERKAAKAVDPERVARRLAKKKARNALPVPEKGKDRVRVRKNTAEHKDAGAPARRKKSRVRSERSVEKRNTKK